jgi:probable addiction module antidote protein
MKTQTKPWDSAEYLETDEDIALYLAEAIETGDASFIRFALNTAARAAGMTWIAKQANVSRESLYRSLGPEGNPEFETVMRVITALGLKLTVSPVKEAQEQKTARKTKTRARAGKRPTAIRAKSRSSQGKAAKRPSKKAAVVRSAKRARRAGMTSSVARSR